MQRTKKSLGQHWLFDELSLNAMVRVANMTNTDTVLEVGPGLGTLTKKLCQTADKVVAVELDDELAPRLADEVRADNLEVIHQSILDFDVSTMSKGYKVVANIPYYLTSHLIRQLLEAENKPTTMVLLVQKEVAERVVAQAGHHSMLSVSVQFYAEADLCEQVPARLFTPPPKVDSQIVRITPRTQPLFPGVNEENFFKIVRAGFSEKRKKLRSSLSGALHFSKVEVDEWLKQAGISPDARAQELGLQEWHQLYLKSPL